ncbi:unnamed protein product [Soboliphyme baturini]|uniref:MYND-type domain-containing protein n=1 Tax=Soboliphyme baturini TaxID=241478 RepID=A0A183JB45_9BILA|nr:unnamed protein product [Soboliphyme baturini]
MLCFYAEKGDVQMSVSALLVLKGLVPYDIVDPELQKIWYQAYIDLLSRYELWSVAALVTKLCPIESINRVNQQSTAIILSCGRCKKVQPSKGCRCDKCKCVSSICNVW